MKPQFIFFLATLILVTFCLEPTTLPQQRQYILDKMNEVRNGVGAGPLELNEDLNILSQAHSQDMVDNNYFSHTNLNGKGPGDRANDYGFSYSTLAENIAMGSTLDIMHAGLMNSQGHYLNTIESTSTRAGVGIASDAQGMKRMTIMFSAPAPPEPRDFTINPPTSQEMLQIKNAAVARVLEKNEGVNFAEDLTMSAQVSSYLVDGGSFFSTVKKAWTYSMSMFSINSDPVAEFHPELFDSLFGNSGYSIFGIGVIYKNGYMQLWIAKGNP